jgi:UDP-N-acetylglucosamine 2-epimerase
VKVLTVIGARPQFIKAAPVGRELRKHHTEIQVHTGQHYDYEMSAVFFQEMGIPESAYNLGVGSGPHGEQTGKMLIKIEEVLQKEKPDLVIVYGDTNSTLAGALAAAKKHIPVVHIEAGLRSYNRTMPEEYNRVIVDHCSDILFCPTQSAVENLSKEGIIQGVYLLGDVMYDAVLQFSKIAQRKSKVLEELRLQPRNYLLATIHRPCNTDNPQNLRNILKAFIEIDEPTILPIHPRTRKQISTMEAKILDRTKIKIIPPVGFLDMLMLEQNARMILTDSGGIQKEAYFFNVPCVTLRTETEWVETVRAGWNEIVGSTREKIVRTVKEKVWPTEKPPAIFGDGHASASIIGILEEIYALDPIA